MANYFKFYVLEGDVITGTSANDGKQVVGQFRDVVHFAVINPDLVSVYCKGPSVWLKAKHTPNTHDVIGWGLISDHDTVPNIVKLAHLIGQ